MDNGKSKKENLVHPGIYDPIINGVPVSTIIIPNFEEVKEKLLNEIKIKNENLVHPGVYDPIIYGVPVSTITNFEEAKQRWLNEIK